ncbi:MAG: YqaJ viral recombinase family protein [Bradymonadales bacterium]
MKRVLKAEVLADKSLMTEAEWRAQRRVGIGGSDAAGILGLNPYSSAFQVYCDKIGLTDGDEDNEAMRQGRDFEAYVAGRFEEATGKKTKNCNYVLISRKHPYAIANVDRLIVGEKAGLECKTTSVLNKTDFSAGDVPPQYYVQCMHYIAVTGAERWYLAILVLNKGFHVFTIERNEEEIQALMSAEETFWRENVLAKQEPAPDGSKKAGEIIKSLYGWGRDDLECDLTPFENELAALVGVKAQIKELEGKEDFLKQSIQAYMKEATVGKYDRYSVYWRNELRCGIDTERLKKEQPELVKAYTKTTSQRKFIIKEIKDT